MARIADVVRILPDRQESLSDILSLIECDVTVANGLRLVQKRYAAGLRMARHAHDEWRFCLAIRGSYTDSWRGAYRTRTPRQLSLHPADESHSSRFNSDASCFHITFGGAWADRLLDTFGRSPEPLEFLNGRVPIIARQMHAEFRLADACSALALEGLACELLAWSARSGLRATPVAPWAYRARDLLHDRFAVTLSLKELAAEAGVHPVHLAREFRRVFGCTVGDYVRRLRVEYVQTQLTSDTPLSDLACRAGFADQSHLTRVFKRVTGVTPGQYRQRALPPSR